MPSSVIVGLQWGDEGKGKITDLLSSKSDYIIRYQGGDNAGHSINIEKNKYILHLVPSGVIHKNKKCIIGAGVVINLKSLIKELNYLKNKNIDTSKVYICQRCHLIMPYHILIDKLREKYNLNESIGTTCKGIGPTYEDQMSRTGIRVIDLLNPRNFHKKLVNNINYKKKIIFSIYKKYLSSLNIDELLNIDNIYNKYMGYTKILNSRIIDTVYEINNAFNNNKNILFEGAQAILLDITYGTYPYVTTSHPSTGGVCTGSGIAPTLIKNSIGVTKAYCTRVGLGPFPTEIKSNIGDNLRKLGNEYGTTTMRPRRCGWLDLVALKYSCMINGINKLIITKLDILSDFDEIKICTEYKTYNGVNIKYFPVSNQLLENIKPIYINFIGWKESISKITKYEKLPFLCKKYIVYIEKYLNIRVSIISVGPKRNQNIIIKKTLNF